MLGITTTCWIGTMGRGDVWKNGTLGGNQKRIFKQSTTGTRAGLSVLFHFNKYCI